MEVSGHSNETHSDGAGDAAMALKTRLRADLRAAMTARAAQEIGVIRGLIAAIDNAEAPKVAAEDAGAAKGSGIVAAHDFADGSAERPRLQLGTAQLRAILGAEAEERDDLARQMAALGKADRASSLTAEAEIVRRYIDG